MYSLNGKISSDLLKVIAVLTMVCDHIAAVILQRGILLANPGMCLGGVSLADIAYVMRAVGRIAFPLFAYLMVEGFFYTSCKKNYAVRMFLFALISEIPYDLALSGKWFNMSSQNVFFTLVIGFMTIWCITFFEKKEKLAHKILGYAGCIGSSMVIAGLLHTDYSYGGIVLIAALYLTRNLPVVSRCAISYICFMVAEAVKLSTSGLMVEAVCVIAFLLILGCNGQRRMKISKWFFYVFYPAHLLILKLIALAVC